MRPDSIVAGKLYYARYRHELVLVHVQRVVLDLVAARRASDNRILALRAHDIRFEYTQPPKSV